MNELKLDNKNKNGYLSLLLLYHINLNNTNIIEYILNNINIDYLLKRDYLNIIKYYYFTNFEKSIVYYKKLLMKDNVEITNKDIDFIIENKLYKLLIYLDGYFVKTYNVNNIEYEYEPKLYYLNDNILNNIIIYIEKLFNNNILIKLNNLLDNDLLYIIDFANIIHSKKNKNNNLIYLKKIIDQLICKYNNIILIIHIKYIKIISNLLDFIKETKILYFLTPYNFDDDLFILWFFFKTKSKTFIISNDNYKDHIYNIQYKLFDNKYYNIKYIIHQQTLKFNTNTYILDDKPKYSLCIQVYNESNILIPNIYNDFININIE